MSLEPKTVSRYTKGRSKARCPLCDYDLWLAPGSDTTLQEALDDHLVTCKNKEN